MSQPGCGVDVMAGGIYNLTPTKPGQVLNPKGINQYTYRDDAKETFSKLCKDHADDFLKGVFDLAKDGEAWAAKMVWEEIMPAIKKVDLNLNDGRSDPVLVPSTDERLTAVAELVKDLVH